MPGALEDPDLELERLALDSIRYEQARQVYDQIRTRRNRRIVDLREAGVPVDELRARTGLSHQRISQIIVARSPKEEGSNDRTNGASE